MRGYDRIRGTLVWEFENWFKFLLASTLIVQERYESHVSIPAGESDVFVHLYLRTPMHFGIHWGDDTTQKKTRFTPGAIAGD